MRSVLLPVDGSKHAFAAAMYLIEFVKTHGPIDIHVVNIEPEPLQWQTHGLEQEVIEAQLLSRGTLAMKPVMDAFSQAGIKCDTTVKFGDPAPTIVTLADEIGCDTIVMGTRGLGGLAALALGSVTRKILHLSKLPVICIQASE